MSAGRSGHSGKTRRGGREGKPRESRPHQHLCHPVAAVGAQVTSAGKRGWGPSQGCPPPKRVGEGRNSVEERASVSEFRRAETPSRRGRVFRRRSVGASPRALEREIWAPEASGAGRCVKACAESGGKPEPPGRGLPAPRRPGPPRPAAVSSGSGWLHARAAGPAVRRGTPARFLGRGLGEPRPEPGIDLNPSRPSPGLGGGSPWYY
jgi:hypothetical protein